MTLPLSTTALAPADFTAMRTNDSAEHRARAVENAAASGDRAALRRTAEEFEAQFLSQMMSHMFEGLSPNGLMGGGQAESVWRDFYVEEVAKGIARQGGIGISDMIETQLLRLQEVG